MIFETHGFSIYMNNTLRTVGYLVPFLKPPNLAKAQGQIKNTQHKNKMCCTKSLHKISRISLNISLDLQLHVPIGYALRIGS